MPEDITSLNRRQIRHTGPDNGPHPDPCVSATAIRDFLIAPRLYRVRANESPSLHPDSGIFRLRAA